MSTSPDLSDPTTDPFEVAAQAAQVVAERSGTDRHDVALVLGSGWGGAADLIGETLTTIDNADVPGFHAAAVAGHSGSMRSVAIGDSGRRALVFGTRTHYYEGRGVRAVVHGVRTAAAAGAKMIVLTNGCGGLRTEWHPGTPVLIRDHINLTARSPIEGANFVDLTDLYSPRLREVAREVDRDLDGLCHGRRLRSADFVQRADQIAKLDSELFLLGRLDACALSVETHDEAVLDVAGC